MKKVLSLLLVLIVCISLSSCKNNRDSSFGKVDFHFSGLYLEFYEDDDFRLDYKNPCAYYKHKTDTFKVDSGNVPDMGNVSFLNMAKNIVNQDGLKVFVLSTNIVLPSNAPDEVKIYVIKEKNGTNYVDVDMVEMIDITKNSKYSVNYQYELDGVGYRFQFTLGIIRME